MKNFRKIFRYIHIPKDKLAVYVFYTLLSTLFSLLSIGLFAPFLSLILASPDKAPIIQSNSVGSLKNILQHILILHGKLYCLGIICLFIVAATLFKNIFLYLSLRISNPVRNNISSSFRLQLYDKILKLPVGFFTDQKKGDIMSRMVGDIAEINNAIVGSLEGLVKDSFATIGFLGYMVYLSPKLSLLLLITLPFTGLLIGRISRKLKNQATDYSVVSGENLSHVEETLAGIKVIKAFNAEKKMMQKFKERKRPVVFHFKLHFYSPRPCQPFN